MSRDYWAKREREALQHYVTEEAEYDKQINKIYSNMLANCQKEINAFYGRYADREGITIAEAKKRVSSADIKAYEAKAERYVKDKTFSKQANEEMRLYNATMRINRLEMLKANIGLELIAGSDDLEKFMDDILKGRTEAELARQAGILGKTIKDNAQMVHNIVNASFHNATFSDRIWNNSAAMKADLDKLIQSGLIQGKNPNALSKDLQKYFIGEPRLKNGKKGAKYRAEVLMRTELARVQTEAQKQSFIRNGFTQYQFIVNGNCCDICADIRNAIFDVDKMMPGENAPPMHPNCRCSTAAYSDRKEYEAWLDYLEKGGTTAQWEASGKAEWEKALAKSGKSSTIELYRKGSTHRKASESGNIIIDKATYSKITNPAIKAGADIRIADDEWTKRLQEKNATAVTVGNIIIFKPDATVSDVLEEVQHFFQNRDGKNAQYGFMQREILNEIEAKEYLLSVADKYKIPAEETELTRNQLESYKKQMQEMKERGEWDE